MISVIFLKRKKKGERREKEGKNGETVKCIGGDNEQQIFLVYFTFIKYSWSWWYLGKAETEIRNTKKHTCTTRRSNVSTLNTPHTH
jgi:hypothetical protein